MKKFTQILLCLIVLGIPLAAKAGDDRTLVTEVIATSNYPDVIGYGKPMEYPDFTMADGSIPQISTIHLQKADAEGNWSEYEKMEHSTFEAGKYRLKVQVGPVRRIYGWPSPLTMLSPPATTPMS